MEIIKHDKTVGSGVQKTLAYDTPFTVQQLDNWRQEFWGKSFHTLTIFSIKHKLLKLGSHHLRVFELFRLLTQLCVETRTSGSKQVWQLLKNACEADFEDAYALILAA